MSDVLHASNLLYINSSSYAKKVIARQQLLNFLSTDCLIDAILFQAYASAKSLLVHFTLLPFTWFSAIFVWLAKMFETCKYDFLQ